MLVSATEMMIVNYGSAQDFRSANRRRGRLFWCSTNEEPHRLCPFYQRQHVHKPVILINKSLHIRIRFVAIILTPSLLQQIRHNSIDKQVRWMPAQIIKKARAKIIVHRSGYGARNRLSRCRRYPREDINGGRPSPYLQAPHRICLLKLSNYRGNFVT